SSPDYPNQYRFQSKIYSVSEQLFYPKILGKGDVLHVPHYNAPLRFPGKLVVTVHDLCHLVMKEFFKGPAKRTYASVFLKAVLKKASKIITVSHFTEHEILKYFHIDQKKIEVIPNGLDPHFYPRSDKEQKRVREANRLPESYLLYVGNIKPHKNIAKLIKAYHKGWCQKPDLPKLVFVGQNDEGYDPFSEAMSKGDSTYLAFKDRVIFKGFVPYEDLPGLYSGAEAFLFPSLYEGFGFPPLEAMACGTAVLASNSSSLPEILNGHAVFIDPYDEEAISSAILQLCK
ncbi:MAG TPA: glycosyltransferase family 1 protein, partial [Deltaproteobacteria bacterium]|nr:glycosyltransferase family 1 protein [Deltaproteobacteria bacterium]